MTDTAVYAAGAVLWRLVEGKPMIMVIHRTVYADVTLPKGKVDPGETLAETAVREVFEETGVAVALGVPVGVSRYQMPGKRQKIVHYWAAEATEKAIRASRFVPNKEIADRVGHDQASARIPLLSGRCRDPRQLRPHCRSWCAAHVSDHCAPPRKGCEPLRLGWR